MRRIILEEKLPVQMLLKMEEPQYGMTLEQAFDRARNTVNTLCEQIIYAFSPRIPSAST